MSHRNLRAKQFQDTGLTTTPLKIELSKLGFRLLVKNTGDTNDLGLSLDGGRTFHPISPGVSFDEDVLIHYFYIRSEVDTTDYSIVAFVA